MKIAHLSDTHLGFRAFNRSTPQGFNQREYDVMQTFRACLAAILETDPDVVIHSGDLFDVVRPSNATIVEAFRALGTFQAKRDAKPFIIVGGNHDTPKTSDSGNILKLFKGIPGIRVHPSEAAAFAIDELDLEVLCVPSKSLIQRQSIDWVPQLRKRFSLLSVHGIATQAMLPNTSNFDLDETRHHLWTYVALGDFHKHQAFGKNVCYAGSTDFTSSNIWEETGTPKGWVLFDTERTEMEFQKLDTRKVIDLPSLDGDGLTADELGDRLVAAAKWGEEMPIVRQLVRNVRPEVRAKISLEAVRSIQLRTLDYRLKTFPPTAYSIGLTQDGRTRSLEASWAEHIDGAKLPTDVGREEVKALGNDLLQEAKELETAPVEA